MIQALTLLHDSALEAVPDAWFLPGGSPERWLDELSRCGLADLETRVFVIPQSIENRTAVGLLVVPARGVSVSKQPSAMACRLVGRRLFVPVDAAVHPPVTDLEVFRLCGLPVSFYHPVFGLSGFDEESALRVSDLLRGPEECSASWNFARPGSPALPELTAVVLLEPPSIEDIFGGAEEEIGSDPLIDLPPAPDEPKEDAAAKARRELRRLFAKGLAGIMRQVPHAAVQRNWLNDIEDWANGQLRVVSGQVDWLRNKELHRLLHLLGTDPEAGLRQAIPLNSFAHRGTAPPSNRLGSRSLHFHPNQLGGRPADFWNVPPDLQEVLRRRYREMADREMQIGRHRRAAYIYAELLGDLVSSANAFKQGKLFREAALLYEHHLKNPLEAARCLAHGGLLAEAIERFEKLGRWLDVADLLERVGNHAAAQDTLRRVVNERLAQNDVLGAAKLIEERLHAPDEALEMLFRTWPSSHQATNCVGAAFQLLARLGRHEVAMERLAQFSRESVSESLTLPLVSVLSTMTREYPHERFRHRAADFARVLIARQLQRPGFTSEETGRLLEHLVRLAPQDRLLSRDANRYLADLRGTEMRARRVTSAPVSGNKPVVHRRFELPRQIQWLHLRREWHWFFALGVTAKRVTLLRGVWEGKSESLSWACPAKAVKQGIIFEPTAEQGKAIALSRADGSVFAQKRFPASDVFFNQECVAGTPSWLPTPGSSFAIGEDIVWTVHLATGRAILSSYDKVRGQLQRTIDITDDLLSNATRTEDTRLSLAAVANTVAVALGNRLVLTRADGGLTHLELPGQAVRLVATIPNTRKGLAIMLNHGAVMFWVGADACIELDHDIQSPIGAFVPGGPLVLVSGSKLLALEVDSRGVHSVARLEIDRQPAVGVSASANPGEFAVLGERGEMTVYRFPR